MGSHWPARVGVIRYSRTKLGKGSPSRFILEIPSRSAYDKMESITKKIIVLEKENEAMDRRYWLVKSPEERLSAVEFLREQFYAIQGYASIPRLTKKIHVSEELD